MQPRDVARRLRPQLGLQVAGEQAVIAVVVFVRGRARQQYVPMLQLDKQPRAVQVRQQRLA
ncbi:hypothetical protein D3C72_1952230 [compost metagenome]